VVLIEETRRRRDIGQRGFAAVFQRHRGMLIGGAGVHEFEFQARLLKKDQVIFNRVAGSAVVYNVVPGGVTDWRGRLVLPNENAAYSIEPGDELNLEFDRGITAKIIVCESGCPLCEFEGNGAPPNLE
jgi:hypothetical protein